MSNNAERSANAMAAAAARQVAAQIAPTAAMDLTPADLAKLDGIADGATANDTDANLRARSSHTGSQTASTISDFAASVRTTVLTGLSLATGTAITAADTVLAALGQLQKQISDLTTTVAGKEPAHTANGFSAHKNGTAQSVTAFTFTKITFSTVFFDLNSEFDTSLSRFTPKQAGLYLITGAVFNVASAAGDYIMVTLRKNGVQVANGGLSHRGTNDTIGVSAAFLQQANGTTDYFEIFTYIPRTQNIEGTTGTTGFAASLVR